MAQLGADVDQLDDMSNKFRNAGEQLQSLINQLGGTVNSAWWQGTDADNFRGQWEGEFKGQLNNVCTALFQTGDHVKQQADQQRQTSGA